MSTSEYHHAALNPAMLEKVRLELTWLKRYVVGPSWSTGPNPSVSDRHNVHLVLDGRATWRVGGVALDLEPGMLCLAPGRAMIERACETSYDHIASDMRVYGFGCRDFLYGIQKPIMLLKIDLNECPEGVRTGDLGVTECWYLTGLVKCGIARSVPDFSERVMAYMGPYQRFKPVLDFVGTHLSANLQVEDLAEVQGMHRTAFSRAFKESLGMTPKQFLDRELNQLACDRIITTTSSIRSIAAGLGFNDEYYFNRFFKRMNGIPPKRYRVRFLETGEI